MGSGNSTCCTPSECDSPSAITISDEALEQLSQPSTDGSLSTDIAVRLLQRNENYWVKKIKCIEDAFDQKYKISIEQFNEMHEQLMKEFVLEFGEACNVGSKELLECYKDNKNSPLLCKKLLEDFVNCVKDTSNTIADRNQ